MNIRIVTIGMCVLTLFSTQALAEVRIAHPSAGTRFETGETVRVAFDIDFNTRGERFSQQFHLYLAASRSSEFVRIDVFDRGDDDVEAVAPDNGDWAVQWQVPNVTCSECLLRIVTAPGRGDYDNSGTVPIAIGADWELNGQPEDLGILAPENVGFRDDDPRGGPWDTVDDPDDGSEIEPTEPTDDTADGDLVAGDEFHDSAEDPDSDPLAEEGCSVAASPPANVAMLLILFLLGRLRRYPETTGNIRRLAVLGATMAITTSACSADSSPLDGAGGSIPDNVQPRSLGVPVAPEFVGEIRDESLGDPKLTNTILDDDGLIGIWLPPGVERIRGIHVNLLANPNRGGSLLRSRLDRQVASTWQFAQLDGWNVWQRDRDSAEEGWADIEAFLEQVAADTGHPELTTAPIVVSGGSRTGRWGTEIANLAPDRMVAYVTLVANAAPDRARTPVLYATPGLLIPGEQDKGAEIVDGTEELRAEGARVAVAMNWGKGHTCGPCEQIMYPFLDSVIRERVSANGELVDADEEGVWLGEHSDWTAYPSDSFPHDVSVASWLVDPHFANVWRAFTLKEPIGELNGPKIVDKSPRLSDVPASELREVTASLPGVTGEVVLFDGATSVSSGVVANDGTVVFDDIDLAPGMHFLLVMKSDRVLTRPKLVILLE